MDKQSPKCPSCGEATLSLRPNFEKEWGYIAESVGFDRSAVLFYECYVCKQLVHKWPEGTALHTAAENAWVLAGKQGSPYIPHKER